MKHLRQSEFKDYVAVDHVDDKGNIEKTTLYLKRDKMQVILVWDNEENKWYKTEATFDGSKVNCHDIDPESPMQGLKFELEITDLFSQVKC